jgi:glycosyltransferase involved in cell wall biosynthesis
MLSPSSAQEKVVLFLEKEWDIGGGSIYDINAGAVLSRSEMFRVYGLSLRPLSAVEVIGKIAEFTINHPSEDFLCRRTRVRWGLEQIAKIKPTHLITTINPDTCECLRSIPEGVFACGVLHTMDREGVEWARVYGDLFDKIICVSSELKHLTATLADELSHKLVVIPPLITTPDPGYLKAPNITEPLRLLYLGRLEEPSKRAKSIPQIAEILRNSGTSFTWTVAGEGGEHHYLESEINRLGLKEVNIIKPVQHRKIGKLFESHDLIISTSDSESFGMSVHEAISWGLVPVAGKTSGKLDKTVLEVGGCLVDPDSPSEFAQAIKKLDQDRMLLGKLSMRGMNAIRKILDKPANVIDWPSCMQELQQIGSSEVLTFKRLPMLPPPRHRGKQSMARSILEVLVYGLLNLIDLASWRFSDRLLSLFATTKR